MAARERSWPVMLNLHESRKWAQVIKPQGLLPSDSLPPTRLHLRGPQLFQTVPPSGDQVFKHMNLEETLHAQTTANALLKDTDLFLPKT